MQQNIQVFKWTESMYIVSEVSRFLCKQLNINLLEELHKLGEVPLMTAGTDQLSIVHKLLYKEFDKGDQSSLVQLYQQLAETACEDLIKNSQFSEWAYQRFPSIRVHFPGNVSVFEFHRDSDYNHPLGEINHFLAITDCYNTAALWVEKNLGWNDVEPLNLNKGDLARLNTSVWLHGDRINNESYTRISMDFRCIPVSAIGSSKDKHSITKNIRFSTDAYFKVAGSKGPSVTSNTTA